MPAAGVSRWLVAQNATPQRFMYIFGTIPMPTFYDRFVECAERWPQNVALEIQRRNGTESYTYSEARRMAGSVGRWLRENGIQPRARIAILADNHPRWVTTYLGIIAAGCTAVPLDTAFHADQIAKLLKDSGSELLFCDLKHVGIAQQAVAELNVDIVLTQASVNSSSAGEGARATRADLDSIFAAGPQSFKPANVATDSVAALLYTSGTTADPKGVMLTHADLLGEIKAVFAWIEIGPKDAVLGVLPLFHVLSQMANLLLPLVKGARVVHLETLNTTELLRALQERDITAFAVVPQFFYLIHERIFKEVSQRGKVARSVLRALMNLNRALRAVGINAGRTFSGKLHATFGQRMRYLITGGSRFDPQIARDFYALGIDVLQAYGLTETTGAAFANKPSNNVIGSVGAPLPGLEARPGDPTSERLHGVVVPNFELLKQRRIVNAKEVIRFDIESLSSQLASTKRIGSYEIWQEDLPRATTRKLKRFEIEKRVRSGKREGGGDTDISRPVKEEDKSWLEQHENQRALKIIREYSPAHPEQIFPTDNLELDLGLDSMRRVELLVAVEQELGGDVEESRLAEIYTVRELIDVVRESAGAGQKVGGRPGSTQAFAGWGVVLREDPTDPEAIAVVKSRPITDRLLYLFTRSEEHTSELQSPCNL